jgi:hypothetical protein
MAAPPVNERLSTVTPGEVQREFERLLRDRKMVCESVGDDAKEAEPFTTGKAKARNGSSLGWLVAGGVDRYYFHFA